MSIGINSTYSSYYTQISNNSRSNTDKTTVSNKSTTDKTTSKDEYFKNLCSKCPDANINMSDLYLMKKNEVTFNFSLKLIEKAINDPKAAKNLDRLINLIPSTQQDFSTPKYTPDGRKINSVSFVVDENGGVSCKIEVETKSSRNISETRDDKATDEEKLLKKKMEELRKIKLKLPKEYEIYSNMAKNNDIKFFDINI